jgi:hypothetical protein
MDKKEKCHEIMFFILHQLSVTEISLLRIINILFLSEWYSCLIRKKQLTKITWRRMSFGPCSDDLLDKDFFKPIFSIGGHDTRLDGFSLSLILDDDNVILNSLDREERIIISMAVNHTRDLTFLEQDSLIENLYPIVETNINQTIDLISLAKKAP